MCVQYRQPENLIWALMSRAFAFYPSVHWHGMPMRLTLVIQSPACRGQADTSSEVPTINHTASIEGLAWPKALRCTKTLLSGQIFWGLRNDLSGASQGSNFSLKYAGFEHSRSMESLTWLTEFCQSVVPFQVVLNGCWWMAFLILQNFTTLAGRLWFHVWIVHLLRGG